ncbi:MAG TPA: YceH family protein [Solirubrobacterales bacterium]|nr:YceH family protein [Solirubrobacterales bacterium]
MELDPVEIRVLGVLLEKQRTTPDGYPLSLNSLRGGCNQATNRSPVTDYDEAAIRAALGSLGRRGLIRSATEHGARVIKYRQLIDAELELPEAELSILAVLMLRGAQTPGELRNRADRLKQLPDLGAVRAALETLMERGLAERLPRSPGQKEERFQHLLGAGEGVAGDHPDAVTQSGEDGEPGGSGDGGDGLLERIRELELRVEALEGRLEGDDSGAD